MVEISPMKMIKLPRSALALAQKTVISNGGAKGTTVAETAPIAIDESPF